MSVIRILYIDDEPALLELGKRFLAMNSGFVIDTAMDGRTALEMSAATPYDAIISDYRIPGMNGIALLKEVRSRSATIPFILFTGTAREDDVIDALNNGADYYLRKEGDPPLQFATLAQKIRLAVDRERSEQALRSEHGFNRHLLDTLPVFLVAIGRDGRTLAMNRGLRDALEYTEDEVRNSDFLTTFVPEEDRQALAGFFRDIAEKNQAGATQSRLVSRSGKVFSVGWHGRMTGGTGDIPGFFVGIGIDTTGRPGPGESPSGDGRALLEANRKISLLTSTTRHDILNQLMVLRGFLDLACKKEPGSGEVTGFLEKCIQITDNIDRHITFTREYQNMGVQAPEWQDLSAVIAKAAELLPMDRIHVQILCHGIGVYADSLLEKVFYNLIDNALKHGGTKLTGIRFSCSRTDRGLVITCVDDGAGISPEVLRYLFVRESRNKTGLGLILCGDILGITGMTISARNEPGGGACFEILVPEGMYRSQTGGATAPPS